MAEPIAGGSGGSDAAQERAASLIDRTISERYRILELVAMGGMGAIYRAEHLLMKKVVALKLLHPELGRMDEVARRFEREAQSASRLSHPGIIQVTDFGRTPDGVLFLVMEHVLGESVAEVLAQSGRLPIARAVEVMRQVLSALAHAHAEGVVHRDLKPDNLMFTRSTGSEEPDAIKILDFGIAKMDDGATAGGEKLTQAGVVFGTPWYMSPEQALGDSIDARSDLYSCGVILYELLTGVRPFVADELVQVISMHLTVEPRSPRALVPEIPVELERTILRAMAKSREDRFASATEFLAALDGDGGGPVAASSGSILEVGRRDHERPHRVTFTLDIDELRSQARGYWLKLGPGRGRVVLVSAIGALLLLVVSLVLVARRPSGPSRLAAEVAEALRPAEAAIGRGDVVAARAMLMQQLSLHDDVARVHYLIGTLDFLDRRPDDGLEAYRKAVRLDAGFASDPVILRNAQAVLDDKRLGAKALRFLVEAVGKPASATLAQVATRDRRPDLRHEALEACERLGCTGQVDRVASYLLDLAQERRCEDRRPIVIKLKALGDKRALDALRKARGKSGGVYAVFGGGNDCMKAELDEAISSLER